MPMCARTIFLYRANLFGRHWLGCVIALVRCRTGYLRANGLLGTVDGWPELSWYCSESLTSLGHREATQVLTEPPRSQECRGGGLA